MKQIQIDTSISENDEYIRISKTHTSIRVHTVQYTRILYSTVNLHVCIPNEYRTWAISKVTAGLIQSIFGQKYFGSRRFNNADKFGNLARKSTK